MSTIVAERDEIVVSITLKPWQHDELQELLQDLSNLGLDPEVTIGE